MDLRSLLGSPAASPAAADESAQDRTSAYLIIGAFALALLALSMCHAYRYAAARLRAACTCRVTPHRCDARCRLHCLEDDYYHDGEPPQPREPPHEPPREPAQQATPRRPQQPEPLHVQTAPPATEQQHAVLVVEPGA
jgi:hypothetical protein